MKKKVYSNPEVQVYALMPMQIICDSPTGDISLGGGLNNIPGIEPGGSVTGD